ncbi:TonB-dependent siderophore receptor [Vibrio sp. WJH972]
MNTPSIQKNLTSIAVGSALLSALSPAALAAEANTASLDKQDEKIETVEVIGAAAGINTIDSTATKMNISLKDTGRSVVQVSEEEISNMAASDIRDIAGYQAGFHADTSAARRNVIRGINTNIDTFVVNGLRSLQGGEAGTGSTIPSTYNLESVTFLSGADSILYGTGIAGGIVSATTKKPQEESETTLGLSTRSYAASDVGNFERNKVTVDIDSTGKLVGDDVLYRIITQVTPEGEMYQDHRTSDDKFIDASLTFKVGDNTKITPRLEYKDQEKVGGSAWTDGFYSSNFINGSLGNTTSSYGEIGNRSYYYGSPLDKGTNESKTAELHIEHLYNDKWLFNARTAYVETDSETQDLYVSTSSGLGNAIGDTTLERKWVYARSIDTYKLLDLNAEGKLMTGNLEHHLLAGVNFRDKKVKSLRNFQDNADAIGQNTISVSDPNDQTYTSMPDSLKEGDFSTTEDKELNFYLKDRINLGDLTVAVGLGYLDYDGAESNGEYKQNFTHFAYDFGAVYKVNPNMNVFASYSQSFDPVDTSDVVQYGQDGVDYQPIESDNYEVGIKGEFLENKLIASMTLFYINEKNTTARETGGDDITRLVQDSGDSFRSHGLEVNATYHITDQFSTQISYAYTDAKDISDGDGAASLQANMTPYNSLSIWNSYSLQNQPVRLALGMRSESGRYDDDEYTLPGYAEFDFGTYYETNDWDVSLVVKNLLDKNRIYTTSNWRTVSASDPRSINLDFKYRL